MALIRQKINPAAMTSSSSIKAGVQIAVPQSQHAFDSVEETMSANVFPLPKDAVVSVVSDAGEGAIATRIYLLNQATLNNIENNGKGAASIHYTYQDGFAGRVLSNLLSLSRAGVGAICFGVSIRLIVTSTGGDDANGLAQCNPKFYTNNTAGSTVNLDITAAGNQTRKDNDKSIGVYPVVQNISVATQFSMVISPDRTATVTFYFHPDFIS